MSKLIVEHTETGEITGFKYEQDEEYQPVEGEIGADDEQYNHRELRKCRVEDGELVEIENYTPSPEDDLERWAEHAAEQVPQIVERQKSLRTEQPVRRQAMSEETLNNIDSALDNVSDPAAADAIRELAHAVTGDDRFDPDK